MAIGVPDKARGQQREKIPNWTENNNKCGVSGCEEDTDIVFAVVNKSGRQTIGRFGQFGSAKRFDGEMVLTMFPGNQFVRWITRCSKCYMQEYDRSKHE